MAEEEAAAEEEVAEAAANGDGQLVELFEEARQCRRSKYSTKSTLTTCASVFGFGDIASTTSKGSLREPDRGTVGHIQWK